MMNGEHNNTSPEQEPAQWPDAAEILGRAASVLDNDMLSMLHEQMEDPEGMDPQDMLGAIYGSLIEGGHDNPDEVFESLGFPPVSSVSPEQE